MSVSTEEENEFRSDYSSDEDENELNASKNTEPLPRYQHNRPKDQDQGESEFEADYEDDVDCHGMPSPSNQVNRNSNRSRSFDEGEIEVEEDDNSSQLENTLLRMQSIINKKGYINAGELQNLTKGLDVRNKIEIPEKFVIAKPKRTVGGGDRETKKGRVREDQASIILIYCQAVKNRIDKRNSSSSEEGELINTSDETENMEIDIMPNSNTNNFISAVQQEYEDRSRATLPAPNFEITALQR